MILTRARLVAMRSRFHLRPRIRGGQSRARETRRRYRLLTRRRRGGRTTGRRGKGWTRGCGNVRMGCGVGDVLGVGVTPGVGVVLVPGVVPGVVFGAVPGVGGSLRIGSVGVRLIGSG